MNAIDVTEGSITAPVVIDNPSHPVAGRLRDILRAGSRIRRTVLIDDEDNIAQAVRGGIRLDSIHLLHGADAGHSALVEVVRSQCIPVYRIERSVAASLFGSEKRSRMVALAPRPRHGTLAELGRRDSDIVILDGVRLAGNIGAIIRSAAALRAGGVVLVDSGLSTPYDRRLIRASRGLVFTVPVVVATSAQVRGFLRTTDITLVGLTATAATSLAEVPDIPGRVALLLGGERTGASDELSALADRTCAIPITPGIDSLNVSVAGAIALYERGRRERVLGCGA